MKKQNIPKKKIPINIIILLVILLSVTGITYAKYQTSTNGSIVAKVAKPIFEVRKEESITITALAPNASYSFEVRNYNEEEINEVDMEYYIEIETKENAPIEFSLYEGENIIELKDNKTNKINLNKEKKEEHKYRLDIHYKEDKINNIEEREQNVEIKIHSIQKV